MNSRRSDAADWLAVALAASLPISTSATAVLAVLWLLAVAPTLSIAALREEVTRAASAVPLLLVGLAIIGLLWSLAPFAERFDGLESFLKLAVIPLLALHFSRSRRGHWVLIAYLAACVVALTLSAFIIAMPQIFWRGNEMFPTAFKSPATQSGEFVTCIAVLLYLAIDDLRARHWLRAMLALVLCAGFLAVIAFSATARTPLVVAPVLLALLAFRQFRAPGAIGFVAGAAVLCAALFYSSPYLSGRAAAVWSEVHAYQSQHALTSSGERLEFWKKSASIASRAPLLGHGTGAVKEQMAVEARGQTGPYATVTPNPHQQTLVIAIQLGLAGVFLLWAMWAVHAGTFFQGGLVGWIGLVVVVQNVVGSLFNSHLFDFTQGWTYVVGVGVAAGMVRQRNGSPGAAA